ncbi:hypothetical protein PENTCL1PPCAC_12081 [Pristionchus entomophagus]|uniref:Sepiapterin reductase n=1 Tax=Pristionchus entomophagus TaxID=358040 RepID=A0AAV5T2U7_9BILA|nr:hypothetical protein PENTCL1PPCAC_12081 [Pristionchus entomophagus]
MPHRKLEGKKSLFIVTGASRGIGREIVLQCAARAADASAFLITARNEAALVEVKTAIKNKNKNARVWIVVCDMADLNDEAKMSFDTVMREITEQDTYESLFLFHNAGYLGDVSKKALKLNDAENWAEFLNANFVNMILLNNLILKWITNLTCPKRYIINLSSILAIQGFVSFTQHACGKAAREAFFRGLAVEEPSIRVLNYAPGPVLTDMYKIVQEKSYDPTIRKAYTVNENGNSAAKSDVHVAQLTPEQTVTKLVRILNDDQYESGAHVDYFDDEEQSV